MKKHRIRTVWLILKKLGLNIHNAFKVHIHIMVEPPVLFEVEFFIKDENDSFILTEDKEEIQTEIKIYRLEGFRLKEIKDETKKVDNDK